MKFTMPALKSPKEYVAAFYRWRQRRIFSKNRIEFYEDLATAYTDGVPIIAHLDQASATEGKHGSPTLSSALALVQRRYSENSERPFADALAGFTPESERMLLRAAELSGKFPATLRFTAETAQRVGRMKRTIKEAIFSPLIAVSIAGYTMWQFATELTPLLDDVISPEDWTGAALALRWMSKAIVYGGRPVLALLAIVAVICYYQAPKWTGAKRRVIDELPGFSMYRDYHGALFIVSYASLLGAGVGQIEALQMIAQNAIPWVRWHCNTIANRLAEDPTSPGLAFNTGVLPLKVANRLINLADRSNFNEQIEKIGLSIIAQTDERFQDFSGGLGVGIELATGILLVLMTFGIAMVTTQFHPTL